MGVSIQKKKNVGAHANSEGALDSRQRRTVRVCVGGCVPVILTVNSIAARPLYSKETVPLTER